jgi:hypothetical protein
MRRQQTLPIWRPVGGLSPAAWSAWHGAGRKMQQWALANRSGDGSCPRAGLSAASMDGHERVRFDWSKRAGLTGELDKRSWRPSLSNVFSQMKILVPTSPCRITRSNTLGNLPSTI